MPGYYDLSLGAEFPGSYTRDSALWLLVYPRISYDAFYSDLFILFCFGESFVVHHLLKDVVHVGSPHIYEALIIVYLLMSSEGVTLITWPCHVRQSAILLLHCFNETPS